MSGEDNFYCLLVDIKITTLKGGFKNENLFLRNMLFSSKKT